jgi:YidC/Oxa1 family membrane protein insertase
MRKKELKKAGIEHTQLVSPGSMTFGLVDALADLFLFILKGIHSVFPNWGISIIFLTILVAAALYPLNKKGQVSMHKMQKLQPEMKKLRKKHKNNKQKMNEEVMKLYHKHGINPVGGCFPLFIQLPIFIGLLYALRGSFELRQSGFLWIKDLSLPDALVDINIWRITSLNILPIIMTIAMLIQNKLNAPPAPEKSNSNEPDTQKQMQGAMKIMPWIMLVIFYSFPSGLALYWTTNTVIRIFESYHIKKRLIPRLEEKQAVSPAQNSKG